MLAALVQEDEVAIWPVEATLERPAPPATHNEIAGALTEWESFAGPATDPPVSQEAPSAEVVDLTGASEDRTEATADALAAPPAPDAREPAPPLVDSFLAEPTSEPVIQPAQPALPDDAAMQTARILEAIAERVRNGEIVVARSHRPGGREGDAAVLAAVLASLLGGHNGA